jgi:hypothetical protein
MFFTHVFDGKMYSCELCATFVSEMHLQLVDGWLYRRFIGLVSKLQSKTQKTHPAAQRGTPGTPPVPDPVLAAG